MEAIFSIWKRNREIYLTYLNNYSVEQLNKIPEGFSNNLIWNIAHVIVCQQVLVYKFSGLDTYVSDELIKTYGPGTRPVKEVSADEVEILKSLLLTLIDKTISDYKDEKFITYKKLETSMGFHINSIKGALEYNNYHEGLHLGYIMNIKRFV